MSKSKTTRHALLASATALLLCVVMLIGTTFAWFTDTASTSVNTIQAGTLDVAIEMLENGEWVNAENKTLDFAKAVGAAEGEQVLWEPGCTYELESFKIKNDGNLALKYKIEISGITGDNDLKDAIVWTIKVDNTEIELDKYEGHLAADSSDAAVDIVTISGHMKEEAGNIYQNKSIDSVAITVYATQDMVEYDSTTNEYDKEAAYPVVDQTKLKDALTAGGVVTLGSNVPVTAMASISDGKTSLIGWADITADTVLNLNGQTIKFDDASKTESLEDYPVFMFVRTGATLTINGEGTIDADLGENGAYGINVMGGTVVINGGNYYGACTAIQVQTGTLVINDGFFDMVASSKEQTPQYAKFVVNCIDKNFQDGTAKISITGGTFVNFDPSDNPEGAGTTYVAEGYTVTSEVQSNGETWYTVVPETANP